MWIAVEFFQHGLEDMKLVHLFYDIWLQRSLYDDKL